MKRTLFPLIAAAASLTICWSCSEPEPDNGTVENSVLFKKVYIGNNQKTHDIF